MSTAAFPVDTVLDRIEAAIAGYRPAAMFELKQKGYNSLYEQLISCIISIRTYDETSVPVSEQLFARARTPQEMVELSEEELTQLIADSTYPGQKAPNILRLSQQIIDEYGGETPADFEQLTAFKGVGPKCANLALGVALNYPAISVDVHVHRITNRWGYVATKTPEKTMKALEEKLPREHWVRINRLLVPFGKHVCRGRYPKCGSCPVREWCARVGV